MRLLYLFAKPPAATLPALKRLRASLGIEGRYALDRLHCTLLPLGAATPQAIARARTVLDSFHADPFAVTFDHIEGNTLKPRKGQRAPGALHRALARHFALAGVTLPDYDFGLHLNLDYGNPSERRVSIPPLGWTIDEILLIESGNGTHIVHGSCPLFVRQYALAL